MPIFRIKDKLVFFAHVPKCAGTSVENYMSKRFGPAALLDRHHNRRRRKWTMTSPQHADLNALERLFPKGFFDAVFAVVRHPADRLVSAYLFQKHVEKRVDDTQGFDDWLETLPDLVNSRKRVYDNHFKLQSDLVPANATIFHLEDGLDPVVEYLDQIDEGAAPDISFQHDLSGPKSEKITLGPDHHEFIEKVYQADYDRFGYTRLSGNLAAPKIAPVVGDVIAIKTCVPSEDVKQVWGDYHFARSLASAFETLGYTARVDIMPNWGRRSPNDRLDIVLQGHDTFVPHPDVPSINWFIYPGKRFNLEDLHQYDLCLVASDIYANRLRNRFPDLNPLVLLQAFDHEIMRPAESPAREDFVFVGNNHFRSERPVIQAAKMSGLPIRIWGNNWEKSGLGDSVVNTQIANDQLGALYANSAAVLCDHSGPMARDGFLSNRVFDALACGVPIIMDKIADLPDEFAPYVYSVADEAEYKAAVTEVMAESSERQNQRLAFSLKMRERHNFVARAKEIINLVRSRGFVSFDIEATESANNA